MVLIPCNEDCVEREDTHPMRDRVRSFGILSSSVRTGLPTVNHGYDDMSAIAHFLIIAG